MPPISESFTSLSADLASLAWAIKDAFEHLDLTWPNWWHLKHLLGLRFLRDLNRLLNILIKISIKNETISFPIHDDSEMELFERLFHQVIDKIDLSIDEQRFIPHDGMDVHEHWL